jgi:Tfp pilus assembly protein PilP
MKSKLLLCLLLVGCGPNYAALDYHKKELQTLVEQQTREEQARSKLYADLLSKGDEAGLKRYEDSRATWQEQQAALSLKIAETKKSVEDLTGP